MQRLRPVRKVANTIPSFYLFDTKDQCCYCPFAVQTISCVQVNLLFFEREDLHVSQAELLVGYALPTISFT